MPAKCQRCRSGSAEVYIPYVKRSLCPVCFREFYVNRVKRTVEGYRMFKPEDRVGVAVSGGKDSAALIHALNEAFPDASLVALHIDLGIQNYSSHCKIKVEELVKILDVELYVFDLKKELGFSIDDFRMTFYKRKICSACGTVKRHILEVLAERAGTKVLATGHNLDDIVATMLNNFFNGNWAQLVRLKPVLKPIVANQTFKVKPLIKSPENENLLYCLYSEIPFREVNCQNAHIEKLAKDREMLEYLSKNNPGFRYQMLKNFFRLIPILEKNFEKLKLTKCKICGFLSSAEICAFCKRVAMIKNAKQG